VTTVPFCKSAAVSLCTFLEKQLSGDMEAENGFNNNYLNHGNKRLRDQHELYCDQNIPNNACFPSQTAPKRHKITHQEDSEMTSMIDVSAPSAFAATPQVEVVEELLCRVQVQYQGFNMLDYRVLDVHTAEEVARAVDYLGNQRITWCSGGGQMLSVPCSSFQLQFFQDQGKVAAFKQCFEDSEVSTEKLIDLILQTAQMF
jgi:hypothetical protein